MTLEKVRTITGLVGNVLAVLTLAVSICGLLLLMRYHGLL